MDISGHLWNNLEQYNGEVYIWNALVHCDLSLCPLILSLAPLCVSRLLAALTE